MIKEKVKTQKGLVKKLRIIRDKINADIKNMTVEQEEEYLDKLCAKWKGSPQQRIKNT